MLSIPAALQRETRRLRGSRTCWHSPAATAFSDLQNSPKKVTGGIGCATLNKNGGRTAAALRTRKNTYPEYSRWIYGVKGKKSGHGRLLRFLRFDATAA